MTRNLNLRINRGAFVKFVLCLALVVSSTSTSEAQVDTSPPVLESISISPETVDGTAAEATVTVEMHVTDALAGFAYGCFVVYGLEWQRYPGGPRLLCP